MHRHKSDGQCKQPRVVLDKIRRKGKIAVAGYIFLGQ